MNSRFNRQPLSDEQIREVAPSVFNGRPHQSASSRYSFISTAEVLSGLRQSGYEVFSATQSIVKQENNSLFAKHSLNLRLAGTDLANVGDIAMGVLLTNSHDTSSAFALAFSIFRLACSNGLVVADSSIQSLHLRHQGDLVNRVVVGTQDLLGRGPEVLETVKQWKQITLTAGESKIFAEEAHSLRFEENSNLALAIKPESLLKINRSQDSGSDLWSIFNRTQENCLVGHIRGYRADGRRVKSQSIKSIDVSNKLNKSLWSLAAKMAELKTA